MTSADKFGIAFSIGFTVALVAFAFAFSNASTNTQPAVASTPVKPTTSTPPPTPAPAAAPTPTPKPAEEKPVVEEKMTTEEKPAMEKMPAMEEKPAMEKMPAMEETKAAPMKVAVSIPSGASTPGCEDNNECFQPHTATVGVGGTVTWTNGDTAAHTVTSGTATDGPDGTFDSSIIMAGKTFSNTFDEAGTYDYFCVVHPWMTGKVVVE